MEPPNIMKIHITPSNDNPHDYGMTKEYKTPKITSYVRENKIFSRSGNFGKSLDIFVVVVVSVF